MTVHQPDHDVEDLAWAPKEDADSNLAEALRSLSELIIGDWTLEQNLAAVAAFGMQAISGADGVGVTLLNAGEPVTVVTSEPFVHDVSDIQHRIGEGPDVAAAADGRTSRSGSLADEPHWPQFGPLAAAMGVQSALSLPLTIDGDVVGVLSAYAHRTDAFSPTARRCGARYAVPAAVTAYNARRLSEEQSVASQLRRNLAKRQAIDRAVGLLMARLGISPDDAYTRLRITSQQEHRTIDEVASALVDATRPAVTRAMR